MKPFRYIYSIFHIPIRMLHNSIGRKKFFIISSVFIGFISGIAAILLKSIVHYIHKFFAADFFSDYSFFLFLFCPVIGLIFTVLIVKYFLKGKLGKGVANILYEIAQKSSFVPKDKMYSQILTSSITVGFGGSAGLESPIVVTGAAIGSNYGRIYQLSYKERTVLLAAGSAAGIAAAFNAPIAGIMFAIEILLPDIVVAEMIPVIIAAVSGALCSKIVLNEEILFTFKLQQNFDYHNVPFYILLGLFTGFLSFYYCKMTHKIESIFEKFRQKTFTKTIVGGLTLGILCLLFPPLFGEGYESIRLLADGNASKILSDGLFSLEQSNVFFLLFFIGVILFIKVIATTLTLSSGGNGGNFAPTLFVGAFSGFFFSRALNLTQSFKIPESNFTLVGMSGVLSGVMHAPLTAIFLIAEITGGYELMIPLMIVASLSFLISRHFEPFSMDNKKLASKGLIFTENKDKNILSQIKIGYLVDTDVVTLEPNALLRDLVHYIKKIKTNVFAVVNENGQLKGIITLDMIRDVMFNPKLYDKTHIKDLMKHPRKIINLEDDIESVLKKFDECKEWTLPVVSGKNFVGFLSKSKIHIEYRSQLLKQVDEVL